MKTFLILILLSFQTFHLNAQDFQFYFDRGKICSFEKSKIDSAVFYFTKAIELDSLENHIVTVNVGDIKGLQVNGNLEVFNYKAKNLTILSDWLK